MVGLFKIIIDCGPSLTFFIQIKSHLYSCILLLGLRPFGVLSFAQGNRPVMHAVTQAMALLPSAIRTMSNYVEACLLTGLSKG